MKGFQEFVNNSEIDSQLEEILEHLVLQSLYFDPAKTLDHIFTESYGQTIAEAFEGQGGFLSSIGKGIKGAAQSAFGHAGSALGGTLGALGGGMIGGVPGAIAGAGVGSHFGAKAQGADWKTKGWEAMKSAWGGMKKAYLVDSYKRSRAALADYIDAIVKIPEIKDKFKGVNKIRLELERVSKDIEKALATGGTPKPVGPYGAFAQYVRQSP